MLRRSMVLMVAFLMGGLAGPWVKAETGTLFQSDFAGTQGDPISSLVQWSNASVPAGTTRTIDNNMAKFYSSGTAWLYTSIRADKSEGVAFNFNPCTAMGLRFEYTVATVATSTDPNPLRHRSWVGPQSNASSSGYEVIGERLVLSVPWNKDSNQLTLDLRIIKSTSTSTNTGVVAYTTTVPVDLDSGDHVRLALEVRDGGGNDVRIAYKKYTAAGGTWSDWTTSGWFNPTSSAYGTNAFAADWKTRWTNSTYYYIEHGCQPNIAATAWIDDVTVTGEMLHVATPVFNPDGGCLTASRSVAISCATPGAAIYYTLDGSEPTQGSSAYTSPVNVNPGQTLSARAWAAGYMASDVKTAVYPAAVVLLQSDFVGTQGDPISALAEWSNASAPAGTTRTIDNGMGKFYGDGTSWLYQSIRADKSEGVPFNFQPFAAVGSRFEHTVNAVDTVDTTSALMHRVWVGPQSNATASGYEVVGERILMNVPWNKSTNELTLQLRFANGTGTGTNTGVVAYSTVVSVDLDAGDHIRVALEVRDGGGPDARIAYKKYTAAGGTWSDWTTSGWFNPTSSTYGTNAFAADWKARWANNTYYYIEQNCRNNGSTPLPSTVWIDNVTVLGEAVVSAETPTFDPDGGYIEESQGVTIRCATPNAAIYYTLDGSIPTQNSSPYTVPVAVSPPRTLSARAYAPGYAPGLVKTATYKAFNNPTSIPRGDNSVSVDGDLSEWLESEFVPMNCDYSPTPHVTNAAYAARWDGANNRFYVAVKLQDMTPMFQDNYTGWDQQDGIEVYLHTTGGEPYNYEQTQSSAQQYVLGLKAARPGADPTAHVWATFAGLRDVPRDQVGFQAAGVEELDDYDIPTGWVFYEVQMTAYEFLAETGSIISPLTLGDQVGVDVVVCDKWGTSASSFGMKSENPLGGKYSDWRQIGLHKLAAAPTPAPVPGDANRDGRVTFEDFSILQNNYGQSVTGDTWSQGDFNGNGVVTFADFAILQNHYGQSQSGAAADTIGVATGVPCGSLGLVLLMVTGLGLSCLKRPE